LRLHRHDRDGGWAEGRFESCSHLREKGRDDIKLMLVGDGADRAQLEAAAKAENLTNIVFTGRLNKNEIPPLLGSVDACLVHLRRQPLFESVLPSKIFEAAGMKKPIILGVRGCAADVVNKARAGICIEPENAEELVAAIEKLSVDEELCRQMGDAGYKYVCRNFDRERLSRDYVRVIRQAIQQSV
jgi:colanic acid biosynthesis glycosyl transferase WcaI